MGRGLSKRLTVDRRYVSPFSMPNLCSKYVIFRIGVKLRGFQVSSDADSSELNTQGSNRLGAWAA